MYALVITRQFQPGKAAEAAQLWQANVLPTLREQKGFSGAYLSGDRNTGHGVSVTFWESEADIAAMDASGMFKELVSVLDEYNVAPPVRNQYEVFVHV